MKKVFRGLMILLVIGFSIWLFLDEKSSEPGPLSRAHAENVGCEECHEPWVGISGQKCVQCHPFDSPATLGREIRFHETRRHCLNCHTEHTGSKADISWMDHTLLNGELPCTQCHRDIHEGLFGENCRDCHDITTWNIATFDHPSPERTDCFRCHQAPADHYEEHYWQEHIEKPSGAGVITQKECWRCHTTREWRYRKGEG